MYVHWTNFSRSDGTNADGSSPADRLGIRSWEGDRREMLLTPKLPGFLPTPITAPPEPLDIRTRTARGTTQMLSGVATCPQIGNLERFNLPKGLQPIGEAESVIHFELLIHIKAAIETDLPAGVAHNMARMDRVCPV